MKPCRYIIDPKSNRKRHWGNFLLILTIVYSFLLPFYMCSSTKLPIKSFLILSIFDFVFIVDCILNLLVGFYDKKREYEPKLILVIMNNYSSDFLYELIYTFGPLFMKLNELNTILYFVFKIPRYNRLF